MKTIPVIPSSSFHWMGFAGFAGLDVLRPYYVQDSHIPSEFCVESTKTGTVLTFKYAHTSYVDTSMSEVANYIFEGYTHDGSLITLMIHPNR